MKTSKGESLLGGRMLQSSLTSPGLWPGEWHPIAFDIFYWVEASYRSCPCSRGGSYTQRFDLHSQTSWVQILGVSHTGSMSLNLLLTPKLSFFNCTRKVCSRLHPRVIKFQPFLVSSHACATFMVPNLSASWNVIHLLTPLLISLLNVNQLITKASLITALEI